MMEALYIKLYEKYSKLKSEKDRELDEVNEEQEVKFMDFMSASDTLIKHLTTENARLSDNIDELRKEIVSLRSAKDQQYEDFQQQLMEEKQKNRELSAEAEQLRELQHEKTLSSNITEQHKEQNVSSSPHSPSVSRGQLNESPMRSMRKRARQSMETDSAIHTGSVGPLVPSAGHRKFSDRQKGDDSSAYVQPECCQSDIDKGPCKCLFQNLVECLTGMKVSVSNQPEGRCIHAVHQLSGYSFNLTWVNKASPGGELLYDVSSLGTFVNVAPEWMREAIIFSFNSPLCNALIQCLRSKLSYEQIFKGQSAHMKDLQGLSFCVVETDAYGLPIVPGLRQQCIMYSGGNLSLRQGHKL